MLSGQISQTASQESAVNGSTANVKNIALRNVHIQAVQSGDYLKPGRTVQLIFVAANNSPDTNDKLVEHQLRHRLGDGDRSDRDPRRLLAGRRLG